MANLPYATSNSFLVGTIISRLLLSHGAAGAFAASGPRVGVWSVFRVTAAVSFYQKHPVLRALMPDAPKRAKAALPANRSLCRGCESDRSIIRSIQAEQERHE